MVKCIVTNILVIIYSVIALCYSSNASNLAYQQKYNVFPLPNYELTAAPNDRISLTDGKYTVGSFWSQKTTVGWQFVKNVEIIIDLGKESNIDSITFSTARGTQADVNYPAQIAAFVGTTKDKYLYVGDISKDPGNVIGPYQTKKFALNGIGARGRYVLLDVRPNGPYLFCDEIEVLEGKRMTVKKGALSLDDTRIVSERLRRLSIEKTFLTLLSDKVKASVALRLDSNPRLAEIQQKIDSFTAITDVKQIEEDILRWRADLLRTRFPGKRFLLETSNPWVPLSPASLPVGAPAQSILMIMPQGGYAHAAFVVTNLMAEPKKISVHPTELPLGSPEVAVYHVQYVKSAKMEYVADPIVPVGTSFTLRSGESQMIFLAAHGEHQGKWKCSLKITCGVEVNFLPLKLHVLYPAIPAKLSLNSNQWGYLDFKPLRDRKTSAVRDMLSHHTNTVVIPPNYLPLAYPTKPLDIVRLDEYLQLHKGASKIIFFLNFNNDSLRTANGKYQYMSEAWKKAFIKLYRGLVKSAALAGFTEDELYIYPFDEMRGENIERFIDLASWVREEMPTVKLYATLSKKESLKSLPYLSIAQVFKRDNLYSEASKSKTEIWIYDTKMYMKSLSPYSYFRLMSWQSFILGFTGAGFWNYADTGSGESPGSAWDDFDGNRPDWAVVYEGENGTIVSSRRWEAWRMGVEDYELLTLYAKINGIKAAKDLAKTVLNNPQDVRKADEVRQKILLELSK